MEYTVIGIREVDYVNKAGRRVQGTALYVTYPRKGVIGLACEEIYISSSAQIEGELSIGCSVTVLYNRFHSAACVYVV